MIFGDMGNMMKMARDMQKKLKEVKKDLEKATYEISSDGITVKVSGDMEIREIKGNQGKSGDDIKNAVNKALKTAKDDASKKMKGVTGGLGLPGMF